MDAAFTICSNNYFAQAVALASSFLYHHPFSFFYIILVDKKNSKTILNHPRVKIIEIEEIEPDILSLALRYNIIELNTAVKPQVFLYLLQNADINYIYYIDPDIYIYDNFGLLNNYLAVEDVLLTPHILSPIPIDGKTPMENDFLNFGLYNLGFLGIKRSENTMQLLQWWKDRTYKFGYKNLAKGFFVDQLWMNLVPIYFQKVKIIDHPGYNIGPWNLHERFLSTRNERIFVNNSYPIVFYHFSTFNPLVKFSLHPVFNRFDFTNREDLLTLYQVYADELIKVDFAYFQTIPCYYVEWRKQQIDKMEREILDSLPFKNKFSRKIKSVIPNKIRKAILGFVQA